MGKGRNFMIILRERRGLPEGKTSKTWFDYIWDNLNSDVAFDILYNIFDGCPYATGPLLTQAVSALKKVLPSVPGAELVEYIKIWVEHHKGMLKG
jgi:hypothetical protein